ncbi:unnamed protein product, partial [Allacma fusca]
MLVSEVISMNGS